VRVQMSHRRGESRNVVGEAVVGVFQPIVKAIDYVGDDFYLETVPWAQGDQLY
jgi:hypothetical protein